MFLKPVSSQYRHSLCRGQRIAKVSDMMKNTEFSKLKVCFHITKGFKLERGIPVGNCFSHSSENQNMQKTEMQLPHGSITCNISGLKSYKDHFVRFKCCGGFT